MPASKATESIGKTYGRLTVLDSESVLYPNSGRKVVKFICKCECGNVKSIISQDIRNGAVLSCGCFMKEQAFKGAKGRVKHKIEEVVGKKFNRLTILSEVYEEKGRGKRRCFECICDCGNKCTVMAHRVLSGNLQSCGCARANIAESHRHGTEDFIRLAQGVHGDRYEYSLVEFISDKEKVKIVCKEHGVFKQTPGNHKQGAGCRACGRGFNPKKSGYLYVLKSSNLTKVGITNLLPRKRAKNISNDSGISFEVSFSVKAQDGEIVAELENDLLRYMRQHYQSPTTSFDGYTECFYDVDYEPLVAYIKDMTKDKEVSYAY